MLSGARGEVGTGTGFLWREDPDSTGLTLWVLGKQPRPAELLMMLTWGWALAGAGLVAVPPGLPQDPLEQ